MTGERQKAGVQGKGQTTTPEKISRISGTREWAVAALDCSLGCPHDCRYCYGRYDRVVRRRLLAPEEWPQLHPLPSEYQSPVRKYPGQVMFPTNHDILPENLELCLELLERHLAAGNRMLVVTKPHLQCITRLCTALPAYRNDLLFRFTITARNSDILLFWEPGAPSYHERCEALRFAYDSGFRTSVSVEPMLDLPDVPQMVKQLAPYVTHSIWLGVMRKVEQRVDMSLPGMAEEVARIGREQRPVRIYRLYDRLKSLPYIRWKESIKEIVGLAPVAFPGQDI